MADRYSHAETLRFHREIDQLNWQFGGEGMRYNFLRRSEFLPHALVCRTGAITSLAGAPRDDIGAFVVESQLGNLLLDAYIQAAPVNGIVILQHNRLVYERYPRMRPFDKHLFMSVTKAYVAALIAILQARGLLDVRQSVDELLPETRGSGWQSVSIQDVLDMASGIDATEEPEGFVNPSHPYYGYEAALGWLPAVSGREGIDAYAYVAGLQRKRPPGQAYEYTSVNTFILAWIAERLTGETLAELLRREIWSRIGAEADALLAISPTGAPAAHAGLYACLRDMARFGLLFTPGGRQLFGDFQLPPGYLELIQQGGRPQIFSQGYSGAGVLKDLHGEQPRHNTWQYDYVLPDGDFLKGGYGGQGLYVSPARDLVIAYFGTPFDKEMQTHELQWITRQMIHKGLFDE